MSWTIRTLDLPASLALRFQSSLGTRSVDTRVATWREDDLSIEAVAATETPTRMRIYDYDRECGSYRSREYDEVLDVSGLTDAEISGFVGCPILDSHSYWSSMTIVGVVDEARREGTELIVRFRMAKTEEEIVSKVRDGIIRKVSIGYDRRAGATVTEREGDVPLRRQPFVPRELSLVAIGADPNAGTRSASSLASLSPSAVPSNPTQEPAMNVDAIRSAMTAFTTAMTAALVTETPAAPPAPGTRAADPVDQAGQDAIEGRRAPQAPAVTQTTTPAAPAALGQRTAADEAAIMGLRSIAKDAGREAEFNAFAAAGETLDGLRSLARGYVATNSPETNGTTAGADGQRSAETFISFDEAVAGRRSGGGDVAALAQALAGFVAR